MLKETHCLKCSLQATSLLGQWSEPKEYLEVRVWVLLLRWTGMSTLMHSMRWTNRLSMKPLSNLFFASSFVICLDDNYPVTMGKGKNNWHGDGQNRFLTKPLGSSLARMVTRASLVSILEWMRHLLFNWTTSFYRTYWREDPEAFISDILADSAHAASLVPELPSVLPFDISLQTRADISTAIAKFSTHHCISWSRSVPVLWLW